MKVTIRHGLTGGGVDDRFDFQLVTGEWLDGEGLDYIDGTYHVFGNNGTQGINQSINTGTGAAPSVLSALMTASDHLPVVADYQLPARMQVLVDAIPETVSLGAVVDVSFSVENIASVLSAIGADELDYAISLDGAGSIIGDDTGSLLALAGAADHTLRLDTTVAGMIEATLMVTAADHQTANRMFAFPFSYEVLSNFAADFDADGDVDGDDFLVWQSGFGVNATGDADADGDTDGDDFLIWQSEFGSGAESHAVPEPNSIVLFVTMVAVTVACSYRRMQ